MGSPTPIKGNGQLVSLYRLHVAIVMNIACESSKSDNECLCYCPFVPFITCKSSNHLALNLSDHLLTPIPARLKLASARAGSALAGMLGAVFFLPPGAGAN